MSNESNSNKIDEFLDLIKYSPKTYLTVNDMLYDYKINLKRVCLSSKRRNKLLIYFILIIK